MFFPPHPEAKITRGSPQKGYFHPISPCFRGSMIPPLFTILTTVVQRLRSGAYPEFSFRSRISHSSIPDLTLRREILTAMSEFFKFQVFLSISHIFHFMTSYIPSLLLSTLIVDIFFLSFFSILLYILTPQFCNLLLILALLFLLLITSFAAQNLIYRKKDTFSTCVLAVFSYRLCRFESVYKSWFIMSFCIIIGILLHAGA